MGFGHFEIERNIFSNKNKSKIGTEEMEVSQYKLPATSDSERGSETLCVAYVLVILGIIIVCSISNLSSPKSL